MDIGHEHTNVSNNAPPRSVLADSNNQTYRLDKRLSDFKVRSVLISWRSLVLSVKALGFTPRLSFRIKTSIQANDFVL